MTDLSRASSSPISPVMEHVLGMLERRGVITTDPAQAAECCGWRRDEDGFCMHRPGHPIYVSAEALEAQR